VIVTADHQESQVGINQKEPDEGGLMHYEGVLLRADPARYLVKN
jgi:hypothetical protein